MLSIALFAACTKPRIPKEDLARLDAMVREAKWQYDEGEYNKAFQITSNALAVDRMDLEVRLIRAWTLLQTGRFEDWQDEPNGPELTGAIGLFNEILRESPNEFRARQGMAAIAFRQYYDFLGRQELLTRVGDQFAAIIDGIPALARLDGGSREYSEKVDSLLLAWRAVNEAYRELHTRPFDLFTDPAHDGEPMAGGENWIREELRLDSIDYDARRASWTRAVGELTYFRDISRKRADVWGERALARLQQAKEGYEDMLRTAPNYTLTRHDLALVHMALGDYFLSRALKDAEADFNRQRPGVRLAPSEKGAVIGSFFADENLHQSPRRAVIREEFAAAIKHIADFVDADTRIEQSGEEKVERSRLEFSSEDNRNAVTQDIFRGYEKEAAVIRHERRQRRKQMILNLLVMLIYPEYLNQDLTKAMIWQGVLANTDVNDPISSFIRGVIHEKAGELEDALDAYDRFLANSSPAEYTNRREYVRSRMTIIETERRRREIQGSGR